MGTFPPNKVKNYLTPVGISSIIRDNNGNIKDVVVGNIPSIQSNTSQSNDKANQIFELLTNWKISYNLYKEFEKTGDNITKITCYSDNTKTKKLFTKTINYLNDNIISTNLKDEITNKTLLTTLAYLNNEIINITNTII